MSRSVNKAILVGRIGQDAQTKFTQSGVACTTFTMATDYRYKKQSGEWTNETDWHNVVLWRQEKLADYLKKGQQVFVEGRIRTRSYEAKDGSKKYVTEVIADQVLLLGGGGQKEEQQSASTATDNWGDMPF